MFGVDPRNGLHEKHSNHRAHQATPIIDVESNASECNCTKSSGVGTWLFTDCSYITVLVTSSANENSYSSDR
jgi:hypothetical protein